ncbi:MAG: transcriptional repressor [Actinobacteria bacterium]|nr:transcriptional repressor [Actinomycetota bacterium]MBM3712666.1 transcriptional repressor [Actinomycetota bacterium]
MGEILKESPADYDGWLFILEKKLKDLGYKFTGQRKLILEALSSELKLFDAESVFMEARKADPSIGIATVYRTLELLSRLNLICKISVGMDKSMYMLSYDCRKETSVYMICDNCKRVITNNTCLKSAVKIRLKEDAEDNILKNCNLKIDKFQVVFTGLCDKCIKG